MSNKAIGQFFSGTRVSDLLVLASNIENIDSISAIDPMVGQADMLLALQRRGAHTNRLYGIDIDDKAIAKAELRLKGAHFLVGDAFGKTAVKMYNSEVWDLVITNPPYIRYQALDTSFGKNATETFRRNLIDTIEALDVAGSKQMYLDSAESYSGLSDLAVPCWILCACLVKPGGRLAMVLPDAWLKREYAGIIRKILNNDFTVDRIITDESRTWFSDAQVKTNLLVATKRRSESIEIDNSHVYHIGLLKAATNNCSLTGTLTYDGLTGDEAFVKICQTEAEHASDVIWTRHENHSSTGQALSLENGPKIATLSDWGANVSQGLRTGANGFFYFTEDEDGRVSNDIWKEKAGMEPIDASCLPLVSTLRYQEEIDDAYFIDERKTRYRLLRITKPVSDHSQDAPFEEECLRYYIKYCEENDVIQRGQCRRIPYLSAVKTNGPLSNTPGLERYWYMLPELKNRHLPDLVMPRVNGGIARAYLLPSNRQMAVDANFSTIWIDDGKDPDIRHALLALLNSTYIRLELERTCNVLGGGALKCEAVSLRKLVLPEPQEKLLERLCKCGAQLAAVRSVRESTDIQNSIDEAIARAMVRDEFAEDLRKRWKDELEIRLKLRSK